MDPALNNYLKAADMAYDIGEIHALTPDCAHYDTLLRQQEVLRLLDQAVDGGYVQAYPMKALLSASDDWSTFRLVRPELFRQILLEGIDRGCLAPEHDEAWTWMTLAAENNDPEEFMDDMERYYDLLMTALEHGNYDAETIMDMIWPPEQVIEED